MALFFFFFFCDFVLSVKEFYSKNPLTFKIYFHILKL